MPDLPNFILFILINYVPQHFFVYKSTLYILYIITTYRTAYPMLISLPCLAQCVRENYIDFYATCNLFSRVSNMFDVNPRVPMLYVHFMVVCKEYICNANWFDAEHHFVHGNVVLTPRQIGHNSNANLSGCLNENLRTKGSKMRSMNEFKRTTIPNI